MGWHGRSDLWGGRGGVRPENPWQQQALGLDDVTEHLRVGGDLGIAMQRRDQQPLHPGRGGRVATDMPQGRLGQDVGPGGCCFRLVAYSRRSGIAISNSGNSTTAASPG